MQGVILKGIGGFYTVETEDGRLHTCRARGRFRREGVRPLTGDRVDITTETDTAEGRIEAILPRDNEWKRPPAANLEQLVIVISAYWPKPDLLMCDNLLIEAGKRNVAAVVCVNKCDLARPEDVRALADEYAACGHSVVCTSAKTGEGLEALQSELTGVVSGFAGQSGVGKSSLLNALVPAFDLETGGRAARTDRGKHTTRHAELLRLPGGGRVVDTPGFSLLSIGDIPPGDLGGLYLEFAPYLSGCKHRACLHRSEPACAVKAAVDGGKISKGRYERYVIILDTLLESRRKRYD